MKARFSSAARGDLTEAANEYEARQPGVGARFRAQVRRSVDRIIAYPQIGAVVEGDIREVRVSGFPYGILYAIDGETLRILALAHDAREPGWWGSRL